ncbi:MAG: TnsA-like heteromeric transposase endonuclease subunit [Micropruina sp.]
MASRDLLDVEVRYVDERGDAVAAGLAEVDAEAVVAGRPVRRFPTYRSQSNYPGWLWSVTMGRLVGYESLLERDRLWLADFDPTVRGIASQPFWMSGRDGSVLRRHVPDFMLKTDAGFVVVDVKPTKMLANHDVAAALSWAGRVCAARRWQFEIWSGADPVLLRNVRFLAAGRRAELIDADALGKVAGVLRPGMSVAEAEAASGVEPQIARGAMLSLLWQGLWTTDLTQPLSPSSVLTPGARVA